jgi:F-type H+-transporting ATPase subunit delta
VNPAIQGYTAAVFDTLSEGERRQASADLAGVERLLRGNDPLRDVMTDVAVPARARRAVFEELLTGKVSAPARRLAGFTAGAVHAQEVPAAIAWVANRARHLDEGRVVTEELLGHREARERVGGYAAAVFEDLSAPELEEVEDELFRFGRIVAATPELRAALGDRDFPAVVRRGIVDDLLAGKVHRATGRLADYVVVGGRPRDVVGTLDWLVEQTALARGWRVARVHSGQEVDAEERRRLEATLGRLAGSPVELQVTVDPSLLAGVDVEIGDLRLDATARGRLERLREHVLTKGWTDLGFGRLERAAHEGPGAGGGATAAEGAHPGPAGTAGPPADGTDENGPRS